MLGGGTSRWWFGAGCHSHLKSNSRLHRYLLDVFVQSADARLFSGAKIIQNSARAPGLLLNFLSLMFQGQIVSRVDGSEHHISGTAGSRLHAQAR